MAKGKIACVGEVVTLNVAKGCAGECAFCYARCYARAPKPGSIVVFSDLAGKLRRELDHRRKRNALPGYILLGSASDAFLGGPHVLSITRSVIDILLRRGVGLSISTRGMIPDDIIDKLAHYPDRVQITIPLSSMKNDYYQRWEKGTAKAEERLFLVQKLQAAGLNPAMQLEPIIPYVNDGTEDLRDTVSAMVGEGMKSTMFRLLELRRGVSKQLKREAPSDVLRVLIGAFQSPPEFDEGEYDHIEHKLALSILRRAQRIGREHGLRVQACRCHSPGLPSGRCKIRPNDFKARREVDLFDYKKERSGEEAR